MLEELRARHAELVTAREAAQREAKEKDIGYAYALGEVELWIKHLEEQQQAAKDIATLEEQST